MKKWVNSSTTTRGKKTTRKYLAHHEKNVSSHFLRMYERDEKKDAENVPARMQVTKQQKNNYVNHYIIQDRTLYLVHLVKSMMRSTTSCSSFPLLWTPGMSSLLFISPKEWEKEWGGWGTVVPFERLDFTSGSNHENRQKWLRINHYFFFPVVSRI